MKNIVLIGMPGCGKTTISLALSKKIAWPCIDLDTYLEDYFKMSVAEMFLRGENFFREKETEVCRHLKNCQGTILACGGGVVLREENITYLKENGIVFWLCRDLDKIIKDVDVSGRPLLKDGPHKIYALYQERAHLYQKSADVLIDNNDTIEKTLVQIETYIKKIKTAKAI